MYTQALWSYSYRNLQLVGASCFSSCYFLVLPTWLSGKFKKASAWEHDWLIIRGVLKVMFTLWCCLPTSPHHLFDLSFEEPLNKFVNLISIILTSYEGVIIIIIKKNYASALWKRTPQRQHTAWCSCICCLHYHRYYENIKQPLLSHWLGNITIYPSMSV